MDTTLQRGTAEGLADVTAMPLSDLLLVDSTVAFSPIVERSLSRLREESADMTISSFNSAV
jgi:hypothetical protein